MNIKEKQNLINTLKERFENNMIRHKGLKWSHVQEKLEINNKKLDSLIKMEETGGEPDVIDYDQTKNEFIFCDCSLESPKGRRSLCYDRKALESRKQHKPKNNAVDFAKEIGVEMLTEEQYRFLQKLGEFDLKTSSWIKTPEKIRKLGGAEFCDRRYDTVFVYHNGAESYYAARGFRAVIKI